MLHLGIIHNGVHILCGLYHWSSRKLIPWQVKQLRHSRLVVPYEIRQAETTQGPTCDTQGQAAVTFTAVTATGCVTLRADSPHLGLICLCRQQSAASQQLLSVRILTSLHGCSCIISVTFPLTMHAPSWLFLQPAASASRSRRDNRFNLHR